MRQPMPSVVLALAPLTVCIAIEDDADSHLRAIDCAPDDAPIFPGAPERRNGVDDD